MFTLRSAKLAWKEGKKKKKGESWNDNHLVLFCTIDTRPWSSEGTKQVRVERAAKYSKKNSMFHAIKKLAIDLNWTTHILLKRH